VIVAVIADIHANLIALEAVLEDIDSLGIERIICAGDIVGYYPFPNETVDLMRKRNVTAIKGDNDLAVERLTTRGMNRLAAECAKWTWERITARNVDYLRGLRSKLDLSLDELSISIFHGSPRDPDEYLYEIDVTEDLLEMTGSHIVITAHTHIPFIKRFEKGLVLNPGSVGQPRDRDSRACYSLLDSKTGNASIRRRKFDIQAVREKVKEEGLPIFLGERLEYGL